LLKFSTSFAFDILQQPLALLKSFSVSGIAAQRHIILCPAQTSLRSTSF